MISKSPVLKRTSLSILFNVDFLLIALIISVLVTWLRHKDTIADTSIMYMPFLVLSYAMFRLLYTKYRRIVEYSLIFLLSIVCIKESCLGFSQIYGRSLSSHPLFSCTGSFSNPGPYGGFIAVCSSMFTAWMFRYRYCDDEHSDRPINNKRILSIAFAILTIIALALSLVIMPATFSRTAMLAYVCGVAMLFFTSGKAFLIPSRYWILAFWVVFIMAIIAYQYKRPSADGRFFINKISLRIMCENKWRGVGLGHYLGSYGSEQTAYFSKSVNFDGGSLYISPDVEGDRMLADIPEYAFNEILKIGVECGPLAMLILILLLFVSITKLIKQRSVFAYGLVSLTVFSIFSYPFSLWQFRMFLSLFIAASAYREYENPSINGGRNNLRILFYSLSFIVIGVACSFSANRLLCNRRAVKEWNSLKYFYTIKEYELVSRYYSPLSSFLEYEVQFMYEYGHALNRVGQFERSDSVLRLGAQNSNNPMFWHVMGNNSVAMRHYSEAEQCYKHAFYMVPNRLYPLTLLAKLYNIEGDTTRFLDIAKNIEIFVPKIESINTERFRSEISEIKSKYTGIIKKDKE